MGGRGNGEYGIMDADNSTKGKKNSQERHVYNYNK